MYIICNIFWILEYFFVSEIFLCALSFAWCKVQHAPVTLLLHGILMALLIWLRVWVLWEAASYILDSFLFCTEHVDWVWISCLPCGWCIEVQCLIWVQFSSALLNWQETWLFWWGRKGGGSVFCWLCMLNGSGWCQGGTERWRGRWACGTWQSDQRALLHYHSQNNLKEAVIC